MRLPILYHTVPALALVLACSAALADTVTMSVTGSLSDSTCTLSTGDQNRIIGLDTVRVTDFTGSSVGAKAFNLTAICNSAVSATFTFSGIRDTTDGVRFRNTASTNPAAGVAIWLYSTTGGITDIPANGTAAQRTRTINLSSGTAVLPLAAAYYRTGTVDKGLVSTQVTVSMTYN